MLVVRRGAHHADVDQGQRRPGLPSTTPSPHRVSPGSHAEHAHHALPAHHRHPARDIVTRPIAQHRAARLARMSTNMCSAVRLSAGGGPDSEPGRRVAPVRPQASAPNHSDGTSTAMQPQRWHIGLVGIPRRDRGWDAAL